jgi:hypothetical protein
MALSARHKGPDIKILFVALPAFAEYVDGLGEFIVATAEIDDIVRIVRRLLLPFSGALVGSV